jgi:hypothetical protein
MAPAPKSILREIILHPPICDLQCRASPNLGSVVVKDSLDIAFLNVNFIF